MSGEPPLGPQGSLALTPARMVAEFVYCPRLAYLEWVEGEWADNFFTEDGKDAHRRVDSPSAPPLDPSRSGEARAVLLVSERLGLLAKSDRIEFAGSVAIPVDTKRGQAPGVPEGARLPQRVQVCVQALILRDLGYEVPYGELSFTGSKRRVRVELTAELERQTLAAAAGLRALASERQAPPPLVDDPRCDGCSLAPICLPDEVNALRADAPDEAPPATPRWVVPERADARPLYVQEQGAKLGVRGDRLVVTKHGEQLGSARLEHTSHVGLFGGVQVSTQALRRLCQANRPVAIFSAAGYYYGRTLGVGGPGLETRRAQFRAADDPATCLALARRFVSAKLANQRTLLRRNLSDDPDQVLPQLAKLRTQAEQADALPTLLGLEGLGARHYWSAFATTLRADLGFQLHGRNRRPPRDPVNAAISFLSSLLTKDCAVALSLAGFDPGLGFYHQPRPGKPSLALDFMEEFRPLIVDSVLLTLINTGELRPSDFLARGEFGTTLSGYGRKKVLGAYERRLAQEVTHPTFGYRVTYRQVLGVQARLLGRHLKGEIPTFPAFLTR